MVTEPDKESLEHYDRRAPGWVIRCKRCGFTEPWGKYGMRLGGLSWKTVAWRVVIAADGSAATPSKNKNQPLALKPIIL